MSDDNTADDPIDPWSDITLYDIVEGDVPTPDFHNNRVDSYDYYGFHILPTSNGKFHVQYDGHAGTVMEFKSDDYDDVLELVDDLNYLIFESHQLDGLEETVEWAGKLITEDKEKHDENPELYLHVPEDSPARAG